jgi:hypothetical protein
MHVIFQLPSHLRHIFPHMLVFLELFTRFKPSSSASGFFRTSPSFHRGSCEVAVLPLDTVRMTCQLVPNFRAVPPGMDLNNAVDILDLCQEFSFNPYADYFLFTIMHHWDVCARAVRLSGHK